MQIQELARGNAQTSPVSNNNIFKKHSYMKIFLFEYVSKRHSVLPTDCRQVGSVKELKFDIPFCWAP